MANPEHLKKLEEDKKLKLGEFEILAKHEAENNHSILRNGIDPPDLLKSDQSLRVQERQSIQNIYTYHISRDLNMDNSNHTKNQQGNIVIGTNNGEIKDNVKVARTINEAEQRIQYNNSFNYSDPSSNTTQFKINWKWMIGIMIAAAALFMSGLLNPEFRRILKLDQPQESQLEQNNINIRD